MVDKNNIAKSRKQIPERGFTMIQVLITVGVIGIVTSMAVFGIVEARQRVRLTNSTRQLASFLEKSRVDSVRRHAMTEDQMAGVVFLNSTSYRVMMDYDGDGTLETRDYNLDSGVFFVTDPLPPPVLFDWRGRPAGLAAEKKISVVLQYGNKEYDQRSVDVTRSGDVTIDSDVYLDDIPDVNVNLGNMSGIDSGSTLNGNSNPPPTPDPIPDPEPDPEPDPKPDPVPEPPPDEKPDPTPEPKEDPTPEPTPEIPGSTPEPGGPCSVEVTTNPKPLQIQKNGGAGDISFTGTDGTVNFTSGPSNLSVKRTSGNNFEVKSLNNSRGDFTVVFSTPCGSSSVVVTVTN